MEIEMIKRNIWMMYDVIVDMDEVVAIHKDNLMYYIYILKMVLRLKHVMLNFLIYLIL